jgi:hypothetical protein
VAALLLLGWEERRIQAADVAIIHGDTYGGGGGAIRSNLTGDGGGGGKYMSGTGTLTKPPRDPIRSRQR